MFTTAKQALAELDYFFATADGTETKRLWDVLGLIRGPDDSSDKSRTTSTVRGRAFPQAHARGRLHGDSNSAPISSISTTGGVHFSQHAATAKAALLAIFPEPAPAPAAAGPGLYDPRAALVTLGKVQD